MISKVLIGSGNFLMVAGLMGLVGGILSSFQSMKLNENAGIDAVGGGLYFALVSNIVFFIGLLTLIVGLVKLFRDKKSKS